MTKPTTDASNSWVRVRIYKAIGLGGLAFRPLRDGNNIVPVEAVILAADAALHGPDYIKVLAPAARPADGVPRLVGDQDVTEINTQQTEAVNK
jgi:hypothetical protein